MDNKYLKQLVMSWNISDTPEFRGFRCANCQKEMKEAHHHYVVSDKFVTPVHLCTSCENDLKKKIKKERKTMKIDANREGFKYSGKILDIFKAILASWTLSSSSVLKKFTCDSCGVPFLNAKAWHVWCNINGLLVEEHFCKQCWASMNNSKK